MFHCPQLHSYFSKDGLTVKLMKLKLQGLHLPGDMVHMVIGFSPNFQK
jgi:hypothetical protein